MLRQIKLLAKLELSNLFGWNVFRHTSDPRAKRRARLMLGVWVFLIAVIWGYAGALSWGLIVLGAGAVVPAYLMAIASLVLLFFGIFKAGSVLFRRNGYEMLCSLPVSRTAIVVSRFARMYAEDLLVALAVLLPGMAVYGWMVRPGVGFYLAGMLAGLAVPLLPLAASSLIGAVVTGLASRMKHKGLAEAGLSVLVVLGVLMGSGKLAGMDEDQFTPELLLRLSETVSSLLERLFPPAVWLGRAVVGGEVLTCALLLLVFLAGMSLVAAFVGSQFHAICRRLFSSSAGHDYRMERLNQGSLVSALYKRELKRYFSSGIYVSNTIMGPIMGVVLSGALCFAGTDRLTAALPLEIDIPGLVPFVLSSVFCLMTTTSVSISMEGTEFWIVKSLPLTTKSILDAKILLNLSLMAPFWVLSEILLTAALRPSLPELLWQVLIPAEMILFSCVFGITVNLHLPVLDWESETAVVKQSAASMLGGMAGFVLALVCMVPVALLPEYAGPVKAGLCALLALGTVLFYRKNNRADLRLI